MSQKPMRCTIPLLIGLPQSACFITYSWLWFLAGSTPCKVDGPRIFVWQEIRLSEWRVVFWHPTLGDIYFWRQSLPFRANPVFISAAQRWTQNGEATLGHSRNVRRNQYHCFFACWHFLHRLLEIYYANCYPIFHTFIQPNKNKKIAFFEMISFFLF